MGIFRYFVTLLAVLATLLWVSCGSSKEALVSMTVSPVAATATHGSANNTVTFQATGNFGTYDNSYMNSRATGVCLLHAFDKSRTLTSVTWATSDSVSTSIDANGLATCLSTTAEPATISAVASGVCGGIRATSTLSCN
jgi:hypothetical protein